MTYLLMTFVSSMNLVNKIKDTYIYDIALAFDFRSNNICKNLKDIDYIDNIIFMNPEKVFVHYKNENRFEIKNCELN